MNLVINSLVSYFNNIGNLWSSLLPIVPFIVLIFGIAFEINLIRQTISNRKHSMIVEFLSEDSLKASGSARYWAKHADDTIL